MYGRFDHGGNYHGIPFFQFYASAMWRIQGFAGCNSLKNGRQLKLLNKKMPVFGY
jgi:hypothetical protein